MSEDSNYTPLELLQKRVEDANDRKRNLTTTMTPRGTLDRIQYDTDGVSDKFTLNNNDSVSDFDTLLGLARSQGFNQGGVVPSTLDRAADDFLNALRFG